MAQRVLVTAGASGIGKEIARAFAEIGAKVCVCDINAKALDTAAKDISGLKTVVCDIDGHYRLPLVGVRVLDGRRLP